MDANFQNENEERAEAQWLEDVATMAAGLKRKIDRLEARLMQTGHPHGGGQDIRKPWD